jgi:hypothetical protein
MIRSKYAGLVLMTLALLVISTVAVMSAAESTTTAPPETIQSAPPDSGLQPPAQPNPDDNKRRLTLLPALGVYFPSDSKTQSRFGDSWTSLGLAVAYKTRHMDPRKIELRLDGMAENSDTTSAYIFPLGMGVNTILSTSKTATTYAGLTTNVYIARLESTLDGVDTGWKLKPGASALVGANIGSRFNIQASYYYVPKLGGFDLSGLNISAHVQLIQF